MGKNIIKGYICRRNTPTALQNEFSTCRKMYHNKETQVISNKLLTGFYTRSLLKTDALLQDVVFLLENTINFFKNLNPDVRELLI